MDSQLRKLTREYLETRDIDIGINLLSQLVRAGHIPEHYLELAAVYQDPIAVILTNEPSPAIGAWREDILPPLRSEPFTDLWPCELYQRRIYALAKLAYENIAEHNIKAEIFGPSMWDAPLPSILAGLPTATTLTADARLTIETALEEIRNVLDGNHLLSNDEIHEEFLKVMELNNSPELRFINDYNLKSAIDKMLMAVACAVRSLNCNNEYGMFSESGPVWALVSLTYLDRYLNNDDSESTVTQIDEKYLEKGYQAIADELIPWLLQPFPILYKVNRSDIS